MHTDRHEPSAPGSAIQCRWSIPATRVAGFAITLAVASTVLFGATPPARPVGARPADRSVRFVGPFRWTPILPDSCGTQAMGIAFHGALDIGPGVGRGDTLMWEGRIEYEDGTRAEPICCSCSIWHPVQVLETPVPGRHDFVFDFCGEPLPAGRRGAMRLRLRPRRGWPARAETTVTVPTFAVGHFDRPRHRIVSVCDRAVDTDRDGLVDSVEVLARVTARCPEAVELQFTYGKGPHMPHEIVTRRVVPPASEVSLFLDARLLHAAKDAGPHRVRIDLMSGLASVSDTIHMTRPYPVKTLAPADIELGDGPVHLERVAGGPAVGARLRIRIPIRVRRHGTWFLQGRVGGIHGPGFSTHGFVRLAPGRREFVVELDERGVLDAGFRGPLTLTHLWSQGTGFNGILGATLVTAESVSDPRRP